jgi:hypothetical protein
MTQCLLFSENFVVLKYCFLFIVLGSDTSSLCSKVWPHRGFLHYFKQIILMKLLMAAIKSFFFCSVIKLYIFCFRSKIMRNYNILIFDCLSFSDGLLTSSSCADTKAPSSNRSSTTSVQPYFAAL